jgi:hypothetical protein
MTGPTTAKLNDVEPMAWLSEGLERIVSGRTKSPELDSLLSWNWHPGERDANGNGGMMIDNPITTMDLLDRLEAVLPIPALLTPETRAMLAENVAAGILPQSTITGLHYAGDEGGILCQLDLGPATEHAAFVSITHLRFDARLPLAKAIAAYQKHRIKRLRRQFA